MKSLFEIAFRDGRLSGVRLHNAEVVSVLDCRDPNPGSESESELGADPFVAIVFGDPSVEIIAHLSCELAKKLTQKLVELHGWTLSKPPVASTAAEPATE